jgi:PilZ domain
VYWSCPGRSDVSRIRNLSFGGVFIETPKPQSVGAKAEVDFLVEEGQIRTKAVVRHVEGARGMGLEFTGVAQEDRPHLGALLTRLRSLSRSRPSIPD